MLAKKNPAKRPVGAAPGFRDGGVNNGNGTLYRVGHAGYIWSSFASGGNAYRLNFNNGGVNPQDRGNHANGFQLRCLQAFIVGCFVFFFSRSGGRRSFSDMDTNRMLSSRVPSRALDVPGGRANG